MILEALFSLITGIINLIPFNLPSLPSEFQSLLDLLFSSIIDGLALINMFINLEFWLKCLSTVIIIKNIKHIWNGFIWLINLIPTVNVGYWN